MKIAFVFDWDAVIFNRAAWTKDMFRGLVKMGYPMAGVIAAYAISKGRQGYDPRLQAKVLALGNKEREQYIESYIWGAIAKSPKHVFPDVKPLLAALRKKKLPLYVLSAGYKQFQGKKIEASGLADYFREVHIVPSGIGISSRNKARVLRRLIKKYDQIFFLDDSADNILIAHRDKKLASKVMPVLVGRHKADIPPLARRVKKLSIAEFRRVIPEAEI